MTELMGKPEVFDVTPICNFSSCNVNNGYSKIEISDAQSSSNIKSEPTFNSATVALAAYCFSSISMTVMNKYVLSSHKFYLNFFLLFIQVNQCIPILFSLPSL